MTRYSGVHLRGVKDIGLAGYPNLKRWYDAIEARPAIQRAWDRFRPKTDPSPPATAACGDLGVVAASS
jgi:glutathione S-transferase